MVVRLVRSARRWNGEEDGMADLTEQLRKFVSLDPQIGRKADERQKQFNRLLDKTDDPRERLSMMFAFYALGWDPTEPEGTYVPVQFVLHPYSGPLQIPRGVGNIGPELLKTWGRLWARVKAWQGMPASWDPQTKSFR